MTMEILDLERIRSGFPGITAKVGEYLLEGCVVCLNRKNHQSGVTLSISGDFRENVPIRWTLPTTKQMERTWANQNEATESGAVCIAVLLVEELTDYTVLGRSRVGTGIDYWLGHKGRTVDDQAVIKGDARLEVSGIFQGTESERNYRYKVKLVQTDKSDDTRMPVFVSVVEFGGPHALFGEKNDNS